MEVITLTNPDLAPTIFLSPSTVHLKVLHLIGKLPGKGQSVQREEPNRGYHLVILAKKLHNPPAFLFLSWPITSSFH